MSHTQSDNDVQISAFFIKNLVMYTVYVHSAAVDHSGKRIALIISRILLAVSRIDALGCAKIRISFPLIQHG